MMFEKYGLMVDCSKLTERQISMCLDVYPRPRMSNYHTLGEFLSAVFGRGPKLVTVAHAVYEDLDEGTPVEYLQCPTVYPELVRSARANWQKAEANLESFKAKSRTALETLEKIHKEKVIRSEQRGYERGLADAEKMLRRKLLVEANAAHLEIEENLATYTDGIRVDLGECIELLEQTPDDRTSGAYVFIMELSKRFTKRLKVYSNRRPPDVSPV